ncbi:YpsA SLOG family protein [Thermodesulfobacteriota bacterium]
MLRKIISAGQTGTEQAALDAAIELDIPHGGWVPKGQSIDADPLLGKYNVQEMLVSSRLRVIEQNVIDSDGTLLISHEELSGELADARDMAVQHARPWIHVDLNMTTELDAALKTSIWMIEHNIRVLNVSGSKASKDPEVYEKAKDIVEGIIHLIQFQDNRYSIDTLSAETIAPKTVAEAVSRLVSKLPLKDKTTIANMTADELESLSPTLGEYVRHFFMQWAGNKELMASCRFVSKKDIPDENAASKIILEELWDNLRKTHKLRIVK